MIFPLEQVPHTSPDDLNKLLFEKLGKKPKFRGRLLAHFHRITIKGKT
jgi:hypothetical protein